MPKTAKDKYNEGVASEADASLARRIKLERAARELYNVWAYRAGVHIPWERCHQEAWIAVVVYCESGSTRCQECGSKLACASCRARERAKEAGNA